MLFSINKIANELNMTYQMMWMSCCWHYSSIYSQKEGKSDLITNTIEFADSVRLIITCIAFLLKARHKNGIRVFLAY